MSPELPSYWTVPAVTYCKLPMLVEIIEEELVLEDAIEEEPVLEEELLLELTELEDDEFKLDSRLQLPLNIKLETTPKVASIEIPIFPSIEKILTICFTSDEKLQF